MPGVTNPNEFNLDQNTYYRAPNIMIVPSSNGVDEGKIYTEYNGRRITINITDKNYVVEPQPERQKPTGIAVPGTGGYAIVLNNTNTGVIIKPGKAMINGCAIYVDVDMPFRFPKQDELVTDDNSPYKGYALLCLHTNFDAKDDIDGNVQVDGVWYCAGVDVRYATLEDYLADPKNHLLLGGVNPDKVPPIKPNDDLYNRIDAKYISIHIEADPETGAPPTQIVNLENFINNILHGYWVSKAGDNEYGELLFKSQPAGFFSEDFDYTTEDPLTSNKFGVKVTKTGGGIIIKPENEASNNIVNHILPAIVGFYEGTYKGDSNKIFDAEVLYEKLNQYGKVLIMKSVSDTTTNDTGVVKSMVQAPDGFVSITAEHNSAAHNGVQQGNVVYATEDLGQIGHGNDKSTVYAPTINYLIDNQNDIRTQATADTSKFARMSAINAIIELSSNTGKPTVHIVTETGTPILKFDKNNPGLTGQISLANTNYAKGGNNRAWKNVLEVADNIKVVGTDGGSIYATGFIYLGKADNPATVQVPDYAHGGPRNLRPYDVYSEGQVWSAVYNDYAEMFKVSPEYKGMDLTGLLLAIDKNNPEYCVIADKKNTAIVGVVTENPAYCCGSINKNDIAFPVALAGRVWVRYHGRKAPEIGDFVGLHKTVPGHVTKCRYNSKYRCGKIVEVMDRQYVRILVLL